MFKEREVTCSVRATPPFEDSQPIASVWFDVELQLAEKGSLYFTAALGGFNSTGQEELTGFPRKGHSMNYSKQYKHLLLSIVL